ncbi:MAG: GNAT family N-acetyltransferase [Gemmatimonadetes bacterium]|nr:GNAT family N-acetyltransferase [Gemmatimonadota bacterium]
MFEIVRHGHAHELLTRSGAFLENRESENNLPLGLAHTLARDPRYYGDDPPLLLSILENGNPVGVAVRTPPHRIVLSIFDTVIDAAVDRLVKHLRSSELPVPGVVGPERESRCFSDTWKKVFPDIAATVSTRLRIFEARSVVDVPISPGRMRLAELEDHPLMAEWIAAFSREAIGQEADPTEALAKAKKYIGERNLYIWDHEGPVSIARESRAMKNGTVVTLVYTPPESRNRGYATSCVYELTKKLLAGRYRFCSLFTDLANPTSNRIYPKVGYVPLGDTLEFDFDYTAVPAGC